MPSRSYRSPAGRLRRNESRDGGVRCAGQSRDSHAGKEDAANSSAAGEEYKCNINKRRGGGCKANSCPKWCCLAPELMGNVCPA